MEGIVDQSTAQYASLRKRLLSIFIDFISVLIISSIYFLTPLSSWVEWQFITKTPDILILQQNYKNGLYSDFEYKNRLHDYQNPQLLNVWHDYDTKKPKMEYSELLEKKEDILEKEQETRHLELIKLKETSAVFDRNDYSRAARLARCRYEAVRDKYMRPTDENIPVFWVTGFLLCLGWFWKGSSMGKAALNNTLVDIQTGKRPSLFRCFLRYGVLLGFLLLYKFDDIAIWICPIDPTFPFKSNDELSFLWILLPYIPVLFTQKRQALHDLIAGTGVLEPATALRKWPRSIDIAFDVMALIFVYGLLLFYMAAMSI